MHGAGLSGLFLNCARAHQGIVIRYFPLLWCATISGLTKALSDSGGPVESYIRHEGPFPTLILLFPNMQVNVLLIVSDFPVFQLGGEKRWGKCFRLLEGLGRILIGDCVDMCGYDVYTPQFGVAGRVVGVPIAGQRV